MLENVLAGTFGDREFVKAHMPREVILRELKGNLSETSSEVDVVKYTVDLFENRQEDLHTLAVDANIDYFEGTTKHSKELNKSMELMKHRDYYGAIESLIDYLSIGKEDHIHLTEFEKFVVYTALYKVRKDNAVLV